jgi:tetratricopeptide (TPR) repeat protein
MTSRMRMLASVAVLAAMASLLPVGLPSLTSTSSSAQCVTVSDTAPDPSRADLIGVLERCTALFPGDVELMADLGLEYESVGRFSSAEAVYRRALAVDSGYAELRLRLGRLLLQRGERDGARREAEAALLVQPNRQALLDLLRDARSGSPVAVDPESGR